MRPAVTAAALDIFIARKGSPATLSPPTPLRMRTLVTLLALASASLCPAAQTEAPFEDGLYAEFTTPHGTFVAELYFRQTPMTVASFVGRAEGALGARKGEPFFTGLRWYRVVPNFVLQSGDPVRSAKPPGATLTSEEGAAGHPFPFPDEIAPGLHHDAAGVLSMANGGPDTNSSEFFITLRDTHRLNYLHSVFGRVIRGLDLLSRVQQDEPFSVRIHRVGAEAHAFRADEEAFSALVAAARPYTGARDPSETTHFDDPDKLLPQDIPRAQNFNFKLANFERFTGRKVYARVFEEFRPSRDGQSLGSFNHEMAKKLGIAAEGVLASYFADRDEWVLWIGEPSLPAFMGRTGSRDDYLSGGAMMRQKKEFFAAAKERAGAFAAQSIAEGRTVSDAQRLKLIVDEVIDELIFRLEPKP
jgi:cyclophilin family peptidyl-prolyl cis-trans isomerase